MTEKQNGGGLPPAAIQSVTRFQGLDQFEDRAKAELRKQDRLQLEAEVGEMLAGLGPPESDDDHRRRYRAFLCRPLAEPLDAIGIIYPPPGSNEFQLMVAFRGEEFSKQFIASGLVKIGLPAALLHRFNDIEVAPYPPGHGGAR